MTGFADPDAVIARSRRAWKPPPKLSLSAWADEFYRLSSETAAEPGRWKTLPYQVGILDAITDPAVSEVTVMKSARVGYTLCMSAAIGFFMHHEPSSILVVQPTVDDAKEFSKETIAAMIRDVPVLSQMVFRDIEDKGPKGSSNTLTHKAFPGGVLSLIGANSGAGFRRKSRRVVMFDEVDAYPPSAGSEGDQIRLGKKRAETFWNRKIIAGSTPLIAGTSRIAEMFEAGDQRRYYVPCPTCGHMDFLTFREGDRGHWMRWDKPDGSDAHFICRGCGCEIQHQDKRRIIARGEWRADAPFKSHASFHIWSAYSYAANSTWADIAAEFLAAKKGGPEKLKTFVNTTLGEVWQERGEAPEWERLYQRRAKPDEHAKATVPAQVVVLTCGVDVQRDRLVFEVVGWGDDRQSWSVDAGVIPGDTSKEGAGGPWAKLDELLAHPWPRRGGGTLTIHKLAVDSGDQTQTVYNWARRYPMSRVIAVKGVSTAKALISAPSSTEVRANGKRLGRGYKVWPVGVDIAKSEFYGWLRLQPPTTESGEPFPPGFCHFPEYGEDYFKQITAEHLVRVVNRRTGFVKLEWHCLPSRENHWLDCRVYARAAAALCGLDRIAAGKRAAPPPLSPRPRERSTADVEPVAPGDTAIAKHAPSRGSWLGGRGGGTVGRGGWLRRR